MSMPTIRSEQTLRNRHRRRAAPRLEPLEARALLSGATVNGVLIEEDYQVFLGRQADAPGLAGYESLLNAGVSAAAVASDIANSPEALTREVNLSYQTDLGVAPTSAQLSAGMALIQATGSTDALDTQLLSSPQYFAKAGGTIPGYVSALYGTVLGRAGDAPGMAAWENFLNHGVSRAAVANAFVTSTERITNQVEGAYIGILGVPADSAGLNAWVSFREPQNGRAPLVANEQSMLIDFLTNIENLKIISPIVANPFAGTSAQIASGLIINSAFTPGLAFADFSIEPNGIGWTADPSPVTIETNTITVTNQSTTQPLVFTPAIGLFSFYTNQLPASAFGFLDASGNPLTGPITVAPGQTVNFLITYDSTKVPATESNFESFGANLVLLNQYGRQLITPAINQDGAIAGTVGMDLSFVTPPTTPPA